MPEITIDGTPVEIDGTETILEAGRKIGLEIPTLCFLPGAAPVTTCMVCVVRINGSPRLAPACATRVAPGMVVESETPEIIENRRVTVELLHSEHLGDCLAPCTTGCPAGMDIPRMIRQVYSHELPAAVETVIDHLPIPGILSHVCTAPCENACRRGKADAPISIQQLVRYTSHTFQQMSADELLQTPETGHAASVVGAGPAGLSCAFYLRRSGVACTVYDANPEPGGFLRYGTGEAQLPRATLEAEIEVLQRMGVAFERGVRVGHDVTLDALREAGPVFVATGAIVPGLGLPMAGKKVKVDSTTLETPIAGVFAGGTLLRPKARMAVRSVADGRVAASSMRQLLGKQPLKGAPRRWSTHVGKLMDGEIDDFLAGVSHAARYEPQAGPREGFNAPEADDEAKRCMHCDCRAANNCKLQDVSEQLGANWKRFRSGPRPKFEQMRLHPYIIFEQGKCINCGHCINIAEAAGEELGLTFVGRGYDTTVAVPFQRSLGEGLMKVAQAAVDACPVGALEFRTEQQAAAAARDEPIPEAPDLSHACQISGCSSCAPAPVPEPVETES